MSDDLPTPEPETTPDTERFWEATSEETLLLKQCPECDEHHYPPRPHCPHCHNTETEWVEASGSGTIYSFTVTEQALDPRFFSATPYALAYVELAEGPRMLTNIVEADHDDIRVGDTVEVVFDQTDGEEALPRFRPA